MIDMWTIYSLKMVGVRRIFYNLLQKCQKYLLVLGLQWTAVKMKYSFYKVVLFNNNTILLGQFDWNTNDTTRPTSGLSGKVRCWHNGHTSVGYRLMQSLTKYSKTSWSDGLGSNGAALGFFFKGLLTHLLAISSAWDRKTFLRYEGKFDPVSSILK
jgi:hypothetical protein